MSLILPTLCPSLNQSNPMYPRLLKTSTRFHEYSQVSVDTNDVSILDSSEIIILVPIPPWAMKEFVMKIVSHLSKSIIVACGGSPTKEGDNLKSTPEEIGAVRWVKVFNDNGVIEFINHQVTSSCRIFLHYVVRGISSLPSAANVMTSTQQWGFAFGIEAWIAFLRIRIYVKYEYRMSKLGETSNFRNLYN